jgi:hypothetical protein
MGSITLYLLSRRMGSITLSASRREHNPPRPVFGRRLGQPAEHLFDLRLVMIQRPLDNPPAQFAEQSGQFRFELLHGGGRWRRAAKSVHEPRDPQHHRPGFEQQRRSGQFAESCQTLLSAGSILPSGVPSVTEAVLQQPSTSRKHALFTNSTFSNSKPRASVPSKNHARFPGTEQIAPPQTDRPLNFTRSFLFLRNHQRQPAGGR